MRMLRSGKRVRETPQGCTRARRRKGRQSAVRFVDDNTLGRRATFARNFSTVGSTAPISLLRTALLWSTGSALLTRLVFRALTPPLVATTKLSSLSSVTGAVDVLTALMPARLAVRSPGGQSLKALLASRRRNQWPSGKLRLTNNATSKKLCIRSGLTRSRI